MSVLNRIKLAVRPVIGDLPDRVQRRKRLRELAAKRMVLSKENLVADLGRLPLPQHAIVLVHSSLKALGYVEGGAETVVDALIEAFVKRQGGTVMLPTFSIKGSMHRTLTAGPLFNVRTTPSNLGAIPEAFRRHPDARRSLHPTHSFAAIGPAADRLTADHHRAAGSFGEGSPMARLLAAGGYLLGLGTDLGRVTFYHCLEEIEDGFPIDVFTEDSPIDVVCRDQGGELRHLSINAHDRSPARRRIDQPDSGHLRRFFQERFQQQAGLTWHSVGEAASWLIEARRLYGEQKRLMQAGVTIYSNPSDLEAYRRSNPDEPSETT